MSNLKVPSLKQPPDNSKEVNFIERIDGESLIADKGYDSDKIREQARNKNMAPIIPQKFNGKKPNPDDDRHLYKNRHFVENLFARKAKAFSECRDSF